MLERQRVGEKATGPLRELGTHTVGGHTPPRFLPLVASVGALCELK